MITVRRVAQDEWVLTASEGEERLTSEDLRVLAADLRNAQRLPVEHAPGVPPGTDPDAELAHLLTTWGTMGVLQKLLAPLTEAQRQQVIRAYQSGH